MISNTVLVETRDIHVLTHFSEWKTIPGFSAFKAHPNGYIMEKASNQADEDMMQIGYSIKDEYHSNEGLDESDVYYFPANVVYGSPGELKTPFRKAVRKWMEEKQNKTGTYSLPKEVYDDGDSDVLQVKKGSVSNKLAY